MPVSTTVNTGDPNHPGLHVEERGRLNALEASTLIAASPGNGLTAVVANNIADDTTALQAQVNWVTANWGAGRILLPTGKTLKLTAGITGLGKVQLDGGSDMTTLSFATASASIVALSSTGDRTYPITRLNIVGPLTSDKNSYPTSGASVGFRYQGTLVTIRDISIRNFFRGVDGTESNSFFFYADNLHVGYAGICIDFNQDASNNGGVAPTENGERHRIVNSVLYNSRMGLDVRGSGNGVFMDGTSLDYLGLHAQVFDGYLMLSNCHLETGYSAANNNWGSMQRYMINLQYEGRFAHVNCRWEVRDPGVYQVTNPALGPNVANSGFMRSTNATWYGLLVSADATPVNDQRVFNSRDMRLFPAGVTTLKVYSPFLSRWSPVDVRAVANDGLAVPAGHGFRISAMAATSNSGLEPDHSVTITRELSSGTTAADCWIAVQY